MASRAADARPGWRPPKTPTGGVHPDLRAGRPSTGSGPDRMARHRGPACPSKAPSRPAFQTFAPDGSRFIADSTPGRILMCRRNVNPRFPRLQGDRIRPCLASIPSCPDVIRASLANRAAVLPRCPRTKRSRAGTPAMAGSSPATTAGGKVRKPNAIALPASRARRRGPSAAPTPNDFARGLRAESRRARHRPPTSADRPGEVAATDGGRERDLRPRVLQRGATDGRCAPRDGRGRARHLGHLPAGSRHRAPARGRARPSPPASPSLPQGAIPRS